MNGKMIANHLAARESERSPHLKALVPDGGDSKQSHRFYICSAKTETIFPSGHIDVEII